jgi:uncharacterized protein YndB with AHSA1/START domain
MAARDLAQRNPDINWPEGFSPETADLFAHNEIFIDAPRRTVWRHLVRAEEWPGWYPNARDVKVTGGDGSGQLAAGSRFTWTTFGLDVSSRVHECVPEGRLGWYGETAGLTAYHTWLLADEGTGCRVVTEEAASGPAAAQMARSDPDGLHDGHELWNTRLKLLSEQP